MWPSIVLMPGVTAVKKVRGRSGFCHVSFVGNAMTVIEPCAIADLPVCGLDILPI